jgi:hypothetical protein
MKLAFMPIDNRPVCYTLPKLIAQIDDRLEFFIPERKLLGDLTKSANIEGLFEWLKNLPKLDGIILSLDTIAYGGLIPSRRSTESFEEIKTRIEKLKKILKEKDCKIYAFSSIMRISNNNYNEEEKVYWAQWGKKLFQYSFSGGKEKSDIPTDIIEDYLSTRKRNFEINKIYLKWQKEGLFNTLIFSKDDCAEFGFNVEEGKQLKKLGGFTKTGADEIPLSLLSRALQQNVKICPIFLEPESKNLISNYEDVSIEKSVFGQIELAGCTVACENDADILLYVNNFKARQGEIVMKVDTESFCGKFLAPNKPYMVADVRFANGADNRFVEEFLQNELTNENFYGYSAWNTSANTLGSLICGAKMKFSAHNPNRKAFEKLQSTRLLDDWAYQANVRQKLTSPNVENLEKNMKSYEKIIEQKLKTSVNVNYIFPWKRLFEVEIEFN